jgi:hypothetical protein
MPLTQRTVTAKGAWADSSFRLFFSDSKISMLSTVWNFRARAMMQLDKLAENLKVGREGLELQRQTRTAFLESGVALSKCVCS